MTDRLKTIVDSINSDNFIWLVWLQEEIGLLAQETMATDANKISIEMFDALSCVQGIINQWIKNTTEMVVNQKQEKEESETK